MNNSNQTGGFGTMFHALAALTSPGQAFLTSRPTYGAVPGLRLRDGLRDHVHAAVAALGRWRERARTRQALAQLDDHLLRDIGVSRAEVEAGILPPFARLEEPGMRAPR
jgi:uncharacterized protein YjiS (DUF1127 family)